MLQRLKLAIAAALMSASSASYAGYEFTVGEDGKLIFGGYIKADMRVTSGNIAFKDFWTGTGDVLLEDTTSTKFFVNESRFNTKYVHGDVTGFIEMDFYGGGGNEVVSNSVHPRLRHAFIKYKNFTVGQTWTTFMNVSALPETADFAGPTVGEAFIRQTMVRYEIGDFQVALENPETAGGDPSQDVLPDVVGKYTFAGDWGNVSVAGLFRQLNVDADNSETGLGVSVAGSIKLYGKSDLKFQIHGGNTGRYVGVGATPDVVGNEAEETVSYMVSYRHFWTEAARTSVFLGNITTDVGDIDRSHWGVNFFSDINKDLSYGVEVGQFEMADKDADSFYGQVSFKYVL
ncbi:DcaP family trimeric outer membrane transporter [Thalassotalea agarivorans]|uniref:Porin n=1 Tax=Thalassotalea agarivorans TaxID=349064 RepID=A0A1I0CK56_THASX|nr:DcaP family trimeric outer membrane transporter [Thalassotalea agarivorans]SET20009.1 hypothetical protein SAMN05660429_01228 [Thalassotalea agarivorans]